MNPERIEAVTALLQKPDPFDCWRAHKVTQEGKPERFEQYRVLPVKFTNLAIAERDRSIA